MSSAHEPTLLGHYRVAERVAQGSFGRVLRVIDGAGESRALKVMIKKRNIDNFLIYSEAIEGR